MKDARKKKPAAKSAGKKPVKARKPSRRNNTPTVNLTESGIFEIGLKWFDKRARFANEILKKAARNVDGILGCRKCEVSDFGVKEYVGLDPDLGKGLCGNAYTASVKLTTDKWKQGCRGFIEFMVALEALAGREAYIEKLMANEKSVSWNVVFRVAAKPKKTQTAKRLISAVNR